MEALREQGIDTAALQRLYLKALTRMNSETRYPRDDEAPVDRFDARDASMARDASQQVLLFVDQALV